MSIHVAIGNSDDGLPQAKWAKFVEEVGDLVREHATHVHGEFFTGPASPYQSATWTFEVDALASSRRAWLKQGLARLATTYRQTSIAWTEGDTEMIAGVHVPG